MSTQITDSLSVDEALVQDAGYRFDDVDRKYIDDQIRGIEQHIVDGLIRGRHATYVRLTGGAQPIPIGHGVCQAALQDVEPTITNCNAFTLAASVTTFGVLLRGGAPGGMSLVATGGLLPPEITGLASGSPGFVRVSIASGALERVPALTLGDYGIGSVDAAGYMHVVPGINSGTGGGGGGSTLPGGSPNDFQINDSGIAFKGLGGAENDTVRRVGGQWIAEPGVEVPPGVFGDVLGTDGLGGLTNLGPMTGGGGGGGLPTGTDGQFLCHISGSWLGGNTADYFGQSGGAIASTGILRTQAAVSQIVVAGIKTLLASSSTEGYLFSDSARANGAATGRVYPTTTLELGIGTSKYFGATGGFLTTNVPIVADTGTAYGVHGEFTKAMANANQTLGTSEYIYNTIATTGAITADRTLNGFPHPADSAHAYTRIIDNQCSGAFNVIVSTGTGSTATVPNGTCRIAIFDNGGVRLTSVGAAGTGEANTYSSSGTGVQVTQTKVGVNLPFRSFIFSSPLSAAQNTNDITVSLTGVVAPANGGTGLSALGPANTVLTMNGAGTAMLWNAIVDANVFSGAAIAGTKINPSFGSQNVLTNNFVGAGPGSLGTVGFFRVASTAPGTIIGGRDALANNLCYLSASATELFLGSDTGFTSANQVNVRIYGKTAVNIGYGSTTLITMDSSGVNIGLNTMKVTPGGSTIECTGTVMGSISNAAPLHFGASFATSAASRSLTPTEYTGSVIQVSGTAADVHFTFPRVAGAVWFIWNVGSQVCQVQTDAGGFAMNPGALCVAAVFSAALVKVAG